MQSFKIKQFIEKLKQETQGNFQKQLLKLFDLKDAGPKIKNIILNS